MDYGIEDYEIQDDVCVVTTAREALITATAQVES